MRTRLIHPEGAYYDDTTADAVVSFFPDLLTHVTGHLARQHTPLVLDDWQTDHVIKPLFGWKLADGLRQYRSLWLEVPRKNGKSTISSGIGLYFLVADDEPGAQIFSVAADKDQARVTHDEAKKMIRNNELLSKHCTVYKDAITFGDKVWRVLSSDAYTKHGLNAHAIIVDEVHAHKNRELIDVMRTATGSRLQPMEIYITTAGFDQNSICYEMHDYADKVINGIVDDYSILPVIFAADINADWRDEETWRQANPGLGKTIFIEYMRKESMKAFEIPAYENVFKRLQLNIWTEQSERWMPMHVWDSCEFDFDIDDLAGAKCYAGLDMSTTTDLTSLVLTFPLDDGSFVCLPFFWVPKNNADKRARRDKVPYPLWSEQGFLKLTEGNVVDYDVVQKDIEALAERYNIVNLRFDRWNATQIITHLIKCGIDCIPFGQGFASISRPTKELMTLVMSNRLIHAPHPVLRWNMSNLVVKCDEAENVKPDKEKSTERIDGAVALIMSLDGAVLKVPVSTESIYETQDLFVAGGEGENKK